MLVLSHLNHVTTHLTDAEMETQRGSSNLPLVTAGKRLRFQPGTLAPFQSLCSEALGQRFSKYDSPGQAVTLSPSKLLQMTILRPPAQISSIRTPGAGAQISVLTSPLDDSGDTC